MTNPVLIELTRGALVESVHRQFPRLATPLALNGPPFIGGGSTPHPPRALFGVWPALVRRGVVEDAVTVTVDTA